MGFGQNIAFLRKMRNHMTQEDLAEQIGVSRQTISKWELEDAYPEMNKAIELCELFSCSMDELLRADMNVCDEAFSDIRIERVKEFKYLRYAVISPEPEDDAINHVRDWGNALEIVNLEIIGWDFPVVSQEQINVYHMHGYAAALILPDEICSSKSIEELVHTEVISQRAQEYLAITIREPFRAPFHLIPNAYKTLMTHMQVNKISSGEPEGVIPCFEKTYEKDGVTFMDVYIGIQKL